MRRTCAVVLTVLALVAPAAAQDQSSRSEVQSSKLLITVADPSGGVIPGATVTVTAQDAPARQTTSGAPAIQPATTSPSGLATI
jgi:hypothetical protein